jgi:2-polyprenyl-3-methyl-5-hydroxy-6-metoxy-1,4-benzoquinol methylase/glycosyltransferase involved in cell wall biosynthesis
MMEAITVEVRRPYLSWAIIARNCEKTIEATLRSIRERTPDAEIVVVDTMSSDATFAIARKFADVAVQYAGPDGDWTPAMPAFDDAAAARNFAFSLATGEIIGWIDTDDVLPGPEETERLLRENGRWRTQAVRPPVTPGHEGPVSLEEALRTIFDGHPEIGAVWAPYLYRRHEDGTSAEWQERERFVRNDGSHHWVGKGHEILVPKSASANAPIATIGSLLFVHEKEWKPEDYAHSVSRHYNALVKEYEAGDHSSRTSLYLENFSRMICPWRRGEFLRSAYENSFTRLDRMRALIRAGEFAAENGFYLDALEAFTGATTIRPDLPDAWIAGALVFERAEDWPRAADWYEKAAGLVHNVKESLVNPRDLLIGYRVRGAECWRRFAQECVRLRNEDGALAAARKRLEFISTAANSEAAGPDKPTLLYLRNWAENDLGALECVRSITRLWEYLVRNEETEKAAKLVRLAPHTLEDHPTIHDLKHWAKKVDRHLSDPEAYEEFYNDIEANGALFIEDPFGDVKCARTQFLLGELAKTPKARILEIGCFDGPVGIHVLRALPDVYYVGLDVMEKALDVFRERADREGFAGRYELHQGMGIESAPLGWKFDAIVFYEIIEHVPSPVQSLRALRDHLRPGGRLFVSTPWGAGDRGRPPNMEKRDPRGHVRAMTSKELHDAVSRGGFRVITQTGVNAITAAGLHLVAERLEMPVLYGQTPVSFFVSSSLWDWNASHVKATGIGASEETIVYLAEELAKDPRRLVSVYGQVPRGTPCVAEEVNEGVGYWTREKVTESEGPLIVSRAPSAAKLIDPGNERDKILWLQDTIYPDLNPTTARDYRAIVVLTEWHKAIIAQAIPGEEHRLTVIPNFLIPAHFSTEGAPERLPHHFVYASSPDRGLVRLLKLWPRILERWPDATLDIFYGWEGCMKLGAEDNPAWSRHYRECRTEYIGLQYQPGVSERGRVNHATLAREFQRASVWAYPTHFTETGCLTAVKARAAGCVPVTTRYAGLAETADCLDTVWVEMPGLGLVEDPTADPAAFEAYAERFLAGCEQAIDTDEHDRELMRAQAIEQFSIERVAPMWESLIYR